MKAVIGNYRRSRHSQKTNHAIIVVEGVKDRKEAESLVGKQVAFTTPSKKLIKGKIASAHGNKGAVRAIFERGIPGQALGTSGEISN